MSNRFFKQFQKFSFILLILWGLAACGAVNQDAVSNEAQPVAHQGVDAPAVEGSEGVGPGNSATGWDSSAPSGQTGQASHPGRSGKPGGEE